jgi:protease IV
MASNSGIRGFFSRVGYVLGVMRSVIANLLFLLVLVLVLVLIFSVPGAVQVPDGGALVLAPQGAIVEQRTQTSPLAQITGAGIGAETLLRDVLDALNRAAVDQRIRSVVLNLAETSQVSPAHLETIGQALRRVRTEGKEVLAIGNIYSQSQYAIASHADAVYLHPMGQILLHGYGGNMTFFRDLLDRLKVKVHVFRVGEYKSMVEPYTRNDMSPEVRENTQALVDELWQRYLDSVAVNRQVARERVADYASRFADHSRHAGGDLARVALEHGLVDELLTMDEFRSRMIADVGEDNGTFRQIHFQDYIRATRPRAPRAVDHEVGVIVAQGMILMGNQPRGTIGADSLSALIRQARSDDRIRALVLRIDSPGGTAFGSELIRHELELTQMAGKPVVVSMAGTAASGGYWVSATADEIWASPTTITGSIGIFGMVPTFEDTLSEIGVHRDGVGTTPLSLGADPLGGLNEDMKTVIQANLEFGYQRFVNLVARGRDMALEQATSLSQGQVWSGRQAAELGLVDHLGGLEDAIAAAAGLADIEVYEVRYVERPLSPVEQLLQQIADGLGLVQTPVLGRLGAINRTLDELRALIALDDPLHQYGVCEPCGAIR